MPFDGRRSCSALNRELLISALRFKRHPCWNFKYSQFCALPIACDISSRLDFGLTPWQMIQIFGIFAAWINYSRFYGCRCDQVTPYMVADALERIGA